MTSVNRLTGYATGMDTDAMVKKLIAAEQTKVDKISEKIKYHEWRIEGYREVTNLLRGFKDEYLNLLKPETNFRSPNVFNPNLANVTLSGTSTSAVEATALSSAVATTHTLNNVVIGKTDIYKSSASSTVKTTDTLATAFSGIVDGSLTINGTTINYAATDTVASVISKVNTSAAGVTLSFSELDNKFTVQSKSTGVANQIVMSGDLLTNAAYMNLNTHHQTGSDSSFTLDGIATTRDSNTFTIDSIKYVLKSDYAGAESIKISVEGNAKGMADKVEKFVDAYNNIVKSITDKLRGKRYYDFKPLTDKQKEAMSEKDIELWETKAKSGLLRSDSNLVGVLNNLRATLYEGVKDVGVRLFDFGIQTSSDYKLNGQLSVDRAKLESAIEANPNAISELFTKTSDSTDPKTIYQEEGLANKILDVLDDYVRTTRDDNGNKGLLIEKAGIENDSTDFNNYLADQIQEYNSQMNSLVNLLANKETNYYNMFSKMETAINRLNSQSSWLSQQVGGQ